MSYKLKSKKAATKRFKVVAGGFKYRRSFRSHLLTKKSAKRKLQLRANTLVGAADRPSVERMLGLR